MSFRGVYACLATPFDHRGAIYPAKVSHNLARLARTTLSGYLVGGLWGEGPSLSAAAKAELWKLSAAAVEEGKTLIADVSAEGAMEAAELAAVAAEAGFHAVLSRSPSAYGDQSLSAAAQMGYFRLLADRSTLPVIVDGGIAAIPAAVSAEVAAKLARHPRIVAYRDGTGDPEFCRQLVEAAAGQLQVLAGDVRSLDQALAAGAAASMLEFAAAAPFHCLSIDEAVRMRDIEAARELSQRAAEAATWIRDTYGVAGLKFAMDLRGFYGGVPRSPLLPLGAEGKSRIEAALSEIAS